MASGAPLIDAVPAGRAGAAAIAATALAGWPSFLGGGAKAGGRAGAGASLLFWGEADDGLAELDDGPLAVEPPSGAEGCGWLSPPEPLRSGSVALAVVVAVVVRGVTSKAPDALPLTPPSAARATATM